MKSLILGAMVLATSFAQAAAQTTFNYDCKFAYREAILQLLDQVEAYNSNLNKSEEVKSKALQSFVVEVSAIDTALGAKRAACYFAEDAANKPCVADYKDLQKNVRDRINLIAMVSGNQNEVDLSFVGTVALRTKVVVKDVQCKH